MPTGENQEGVQQTEDAGALVDVLLLLGRNRKIVLGFPAFAGLLALLVVFLVPKWYTTTAKIMPPQQSQSNAIAILGQIGALSGGAGQALGLKNPSDIYVAMLKSRTIADAIIERFELRKVYDEELMFYARKELAGNSSISTSRDGVITIEVEDKSGVRAAEIANAYVDELRKLTLRLAVSEAGQRRLFFEEQLKKAKNDLSEAEGALAAFSQKAGLVNPQSQIGLTVAAAAAVRAQIAAKEIQISAMRTFATESNPDLRRTQQEIAGLRLELAKMQSDVNPGIGNALVPFGKAPDITVEYVRKYRDLKYYETLFEVLAKQYEIARIDEAKDATLIQVLDVATEPDNKSWPKRGLIVLLVLIVSLLGSIAFAFAKESLAVALSDPARRQALKDLLPFAFK